MNESDLAEINITMNNLTLLEEKKERESKEQKEVLSIEENISKFVTSLINTPYINRQLTFFSLDKETNAWLNRMFSCHDWYEHRVFGADMVFCIEIKMCSHSYDSSGEKIKLECKDCLAIKEKTSNQTVDSGNVRLADIDLFSFKIRACIVGTTDLGLYDDPEDSRNYINKYQITISPLRTQDAHSIFFMPAEDEYAPIVDQYVNPEEEYEDEEEEEELVEEDEINEEI